MKQYLLQLNLNEVWTGGISSYSLILMLVCFFQVRKKKKPTLSSRNYCSYQQTYYRKDQHSQWSSSFLSGLSSSLKTRSVTGTTDDYSSSSAASCTSSDDNNSCSNNNSDLDDDHFHNSVSSSCNSTSHSCTTNDDRSIIEHVNLGHMLISFLELYGVYFNYANLGIRVQTPHQPDRPAGFIDKEELFKNFCCGHRTTSNLCIVDPFNDST